MTAPRIEVGCLCCKHVEERIERGTSAYFPSCDISVYYCTVHPVWELINEHHYCSLWEGINEQEKEE